MFWDGHRFLYIVYFLYLTPPQYVPPNKALYIYLIKVPSIWALYITPPNTYPQHVPPNMCPQHTPLICVPYMCPLYRPYISALYYFKRKCRKIKTQI